MSTLKGIVVLLLLAFAISVGRADPVMTQAQASQIAANFCRQMGLTVTASPTAVFPVPTREYISVTHWQPAWQVIFPGQAEVHIVDATGIISSYGTLSQQDLDEAYIDYPDGTTISSDDAIRFATAALSSTGQQGELVFDYADRNTVHDNGNSSDHTWCVRWKRQIQGVPYREDFAHVQLTANTGRVLDVDINFYSIPPASMAINVTRAQADSVINTFANNAPLHTASIRSAILNQVRLEIVPASSYWQTGQNNMDPGGQGVLAYVYELIDGDQGYDVFVDCATGNIIGGEATGPYSDSAVPSLSAMLRRTKAIRVYQKSKHGGWEAKPAVTLDEHAFAPETQLFKTLKPCKDRGKLAFSGLKFVFIAGNKRLGEGYYAPATGRLKIGTAWAMAPERLKAWLHPYVRQPETDNMRITMH